MVLKEPNGLERSKLINSTERNQWSWKISPDLDRSQLMNGLERTQWSRSK